MDDQITALGSPRARATLAGQAGRASCQRPTLGEGQSLGSWPWLIVILFLVGKRCETRCRNPRHPWKRGRMRSLLELVFDGFYT